MYILPFVGERRIRVHTLCLPVTNQLSEIYAGADQQAIIGLLAKMGKNTRIGQSTFSMYIIIYTCIMGVQEVYNEIKFFNLFVAVDRSVSSSLSDAREALINAAMDALASFGNTIPPAQRIGSLPICYTLRMIPTFILALLKSVRFHLLTRLLENFSFHHVEHFTYIYLICYIKFV